MKYKNPKFLFYLITLFSAIISVVLLVISRGAYFDFNVFSHGNDMFMDFFNHISYSENLSNTYFTINHACFPPLAYLFYYFLNRILPFGSTTALNPNLTSNYAVLVYVIYMVILSCILSYCVRKTLTGFSNEENLIITLAIIFSSIFIFGVTERGNSVLIVLILLLLALKMKESQNKILRELALILIAVAAGFKIYPAVFALLYLLEKKYDSFLRLVIYSAAFFFLPFIFLGGVLGFEKFLLNQKSIQSIYYANFQSITSLYNLIGKFIPVSDNIICRFAPLITILIYFICSIILISRNNTPIWVKYLLLCGFMIFVPSWSGEYTLIYMVIPLLYFLKSLKEKNSFGKSDYINSVLFSFILSLFVWDFGMTEYLGSNTGSVIRYTALYIMFFIAVISGIYRYFKEKNTFRNNANEKSLG